MYCYIIICFHLLYTLFISSKHLVDCQRSDFLRWKDSGVEDYRRTSYLDDGTQTAIDLDLSVEHEILLKVVDQLNSVPIIKFICQVHQLSPGQEITQARLCHNKICAIVDKNITALNHLRFYTSMNRSTGMTIESAWNRQYSSPGNRPDYSGRYWCELVNPNGVLISASVNIYDVIRSFSRMMIQGNQDLAIRTRPTIRASDLPLTLDCPGAQVDDPLLDDLQFSIEPILHWKFCFVQEGEDQFISASQCQTRSTLLEKTIKLSDVFSDYVIHANGSLTLLTFGTSAPPRTHALLCSNKRNMRILYGIYAGVNSTQTAVRPLLFDSKATFNGPLQSLQSSFINYNLVAGERPVAYQLIALYRADHASIKVSWLKDGKALPSPNNYYPHFTDQQSNHRYSLGTNIQNHHEGLYELQVWHRDGTLKFHFRVNVGQAPSVVVTSLRPTHFVMQGKTNVASIAVNGANKMRLLLNGAELSIGVGRELMLRNWSQKKRQLKLSTLQFDVNPLPLVVMPNSVVNNFKFTVWTAQPRDNHMLTIEAENLYGITRLHRLFLVVPQPQFGVYPVNNTCGGGGGGGTVAVCDVRQSLSIYCEVDSSWMSTLEELNVRFIRTWFVNGEPLHEKNINSNSPIFTLHGEDTSRLVVGPIAADDGNDDNDDNDGNLVKTARRILANATIECVLQIFADEERLYDSRDDPHNQPHLVAHLKFIQPNVVTAASVMWTVFIVLLILILIILLLAGFLIFRSHRGATYLVYEKERQVGHDLDWEINEKEMFKTYDGGQHSDSSAQSSDFNSYRLPVDAGDLVISDFDPDYFNDGGSFVYNYGGRNHSIQR